MQNVTFPLPYRGGDTLANGYISTQIPIKKGLLLCGTSLSYFFECCVRNNYFSAATTAERFSAIRAFLPVSLRR